MAPPVIITVEDNEVVSVYDSHGTDWYSEYYLTIPQLFDRMLVELSEDPYKYQLKWDDASMLKFNEVYGFPEQYFVDISSPPCDGWERFIYDFG
jgi:hypothetical protein